MGSVAEGGVADSHGENECGWVLMWHRGVDVIQDLVCVLSHVG